MERKYTKFLEKWVKSADRKPLLLLGARQVGKTYLVKELFAERYFKNKYLRIDCSDEGDFVKFVEENDNLKKVIDYISFHYDFTLDKDHLLFIDEAQECLPIIKMMKHFCENRKDIPLIVSGSLVRIKLNRHAHKRGNYADRSFLFPVGKVNQLIVYPMTFDEFLMNYNNNSYKYLLDHFINKKEIDSSIHKELLSIFNDYLFVGGMPEVVQTFIDNKNSSDVYKKISNKISEIYSDYLSDMDLYQASKESILKSREVFKNIYTQLNKENKNFKFSNINKNYKNRDLESPIEWLTIANIVNKSFLLKEKVSLPLIASDSSLFRLYLSDMGLFTYQSGLNARNFVLNKAYALSGIYYENYLSVELAARGMNLFYWKGKRNSELEFLIDVNGRIIPIDAKKSKGDLNSINEFRNHNPNDTIIKVSSNNYGYSKNNKILTIPHYYFSFLLNEIVDKQLLI